MQKATVTLEVFSLTDQFDDSGNDIFKQSILNLADGLYTADIQDIPDTDSKKSTLLSGMAKMLYQIEEEKVALSIDVIPKKDFAETWGDTVKMRVQVIKPEETE